jgi:xanthine dehydrogenase accessory factor
VKEIYNGLQHCWAEEKRCVLATIITVDGSAYRREGARCLLLESGEVIGMLGGGCIEDDLLEHAKDVIVSYTPKKVVYDFRWDEEDLWGLGVGCNGSITIWLEPFDPIYKKKNAKIILDEMGARLKCNNAYYFLICIDSSQPDKIQLGQYLSTFHKYWNVDFFNDYTKTGLMDTVIDGVRVSIFTELVKPMPSLFIVGSGPDAALLAQRANDLNWRVSVIDHREYHLTTYFPNVSHRLIKRGNYSSVNIPADSYIVIMTHNLELDYVALQSFISLNSSYLGILGSKQRIKKLTLMLEESIKSIYQDKITGIHTPIGLDIGAQGAEEITISILAELIAHKNGRVGGSMSRDTAKYKKVQIDE